MNRDTALALALSLVGCSSPQPSGDAGGSDATTRDVVAIDSPAPDAPAGHDSSVDAAPPSATCTAPSRADVSHPTATVGTGTAASCTAAALQTAATAGGVIVFDCGSAPVTIHLTSPITFTHETVIDGGGTVTLDGGHATRIFYLDSDYPSSTPRLTVQGLAFHNGHSAMAAEDTGSGGGAIYRDGGSLTVVDCTFDGNEAPSPGQDIAGGAIYGFGGGETVIAGSTFTNNTASNGGAVGSLNGDLTIVNSVFTGNAATGTDGNPGHGGCGGAIYMDGGHEATSLCGVTIRNNTAGAVGGGFFRVSNDHTGRFAMDRTTVDANQVTPMTSGNAGGLYLEGLALHVTGSTVSRNRAFYNGGLWINTCTVQMENSTIAENVAFGSNGGGLWLGHSPTGTVTNCTIANNHATADGQVAGAIFGDGLTLVNTIIAGNTAMYSPSCQDPPRGDGSGNLQWPDESLCTASPTTEDPMLGPLGDHGGPTETMVPAAGSPARGLGMGCPAQDQQGHARASRCTAGAVEVM